MWKLAPFSPIILNIHTLQGLNKWLIILKVDEKFLNDVSDWISLRVQKH